MKKLVVFLSISVIFILLSACSDDEVTPEERISEFVNHWNDQNFTEMYDMLTPESKESYSPEQFIDRYQKVYQDFEITNLDVTYEVPETDEANNEDETEKAFPIHVEMESLAGPIRFDYQAELVQLELDEEEPNWFLAWDPGFIFPELKDGGEVIPEYEQPTRGQIFDRNHFGLAVNEQIFNMGIVPERFGDNPEQEKEKIAEVLEMNVASIDEALNAPWVEPDQFVPLKVIPTTDEQRINELREASGALTYQMTTGRIYPYGEATAHLIGYVGKITAEELEEVDSSHYDANDVIGKRGVEQLFEDRLKGEPGVKIVVRKQDHDDIVIAEKPVKHGETINLTIDAELQEDIYQLYNGDAGTTAAIDPKTGETLALVSSPAFDPNQLAYGINQSDWDTLQEDPQTPLLNRFVSTFTPGSTIKPITGAIGLNQGVITPGEGIEINGLTWGKKEWGNYQVRRVSESSGPVDLTDALIRSDNIFFAKKAVEMGSNSLMEGLTSFGFTQDFPFTYPLEQSTVSSSGEIDREILLADTGYGQGELQMTALHLATAYTPFLNEGNLIQPILDTEEATGQIWEENLITSEHAQLIKDALRKVVSASNGTARAANDTNDRLSGKTGTAELKSSLDDENAKENGWFVAYPENEDILIAMMIENTQDKGGSGYVVEKVTEFFNNRQQ